MSDENDYTNDYFGPAAMRRDYERQVAAPIGQPCSWCEEAIAEGDIGVIDRAGRVTHHECLMRSIVGSVGHQKGLCQCHGGTEDDPPGMTRRQAAAAALVYFHAIKPMLRGAP